MNDDVKDPCYYFIRSILLTLHKNFVAKSSEEIVQTRMKSTNKRQ